MKKDLLYKIIRFSVLYYPMTHWVSIEYEDYGMTEHMKNIEEKQDNKYDLMISLEDFHVFEWNKNKTIIQWNLKIIEEKKGEIVDVFWDRISRLNYNNIRNNNIIPWENWFWI